MLTFLSSLSKVFSADLPEPSIKATISMEMCGFCFGFFFPLKATSGTCTDADFPALISSLLTGPWNNKYVHSSSEQKVISEGSESAPRFKGRPFLNPVHKQ